MLWSFVAITTQDDEVMTVVHM